MAGNSWVAGECRMIAEVGGYLSGRLFSGYLFKS